MINKVVPIATFIDNLAQKYRAGTIKKPPPIPNSPVMMPTSNPCNNNNPVFNCLSASPAGSLCDAALSIFAAEKNMSTDKQSMKRMSFDSTKDPIVKSCRGMAGKIIFLATNTPSTEGMPNKIVILKSTSLFSIDLILPTKLQIPTTNIE